MVSTWSSQSSMRNGRSASEGKMSMIPPPVAKTARRLHQRLVSISQVHPTAQQAVQTDSMAQCNVGGVRMVISAFGTGGQHRRRQSEPKGGAHRGYNQGRKLWPSFVTTGAFVTTGIGSQSGQGGQPLVACLGVHRQSFKWKHLGFRKQIDRAIFSKVG